MAETIKAEVNIPLTVGPLSYDTPKAYPPREHNGTQYGASWGYGTPSGVFYADEKCQAAIVAAGVARKGATFTVLKGKEADGKTNKWSVTGASGAPATNGQKAAGHARPPSGLTFADISFAYRECLFAASAHLTELAGFAPDGPKPTFADIQAGAATMLIQCSHNNAIPRAPKAPPNLDGEHTKAFLAWLAEYRARPDVSILWPGAKAEFSNFIAKTAEMTMAQTCESNDANLYEKIKAAILVVTSDRAAEATQATEEGEADIPY